MELTEVSTKEMNEVIALFMGGVKQIIPQGGLHGYKEGSILWMHLFSDNADPVTYLDYHTSWDWLMPVVKKIKNIRGLHPIAGMKAMSELNHGLVWIDIDRIHKGVYQFIQWHNQQINKP